MEKGLGEKNGTTGSFSGQPGDRDPLGLLVCFEHQPHQLTGRHLAFAAQQVAGRMVADLVGQGLGPVFVTDLSLTIL